METRDDELDGIDGGEVERAKSLISLSPTQDVPNTQNIASKSASARLDQFEPPLPPSPFFLSAIVFNIICCVENDA